GDALDFGTLQLESVVGRTLGVVYKNDGTKIDGQFFTTLFFNRKGIKSFQLVQKTLSLLVLKIVKSEHYSQKELDKILGRITIEIPNTAIEVCFVDKINLTTTGKIMYVYSEVEF